MFDVRGKLFWIKTLGYRGKVLFIMCSEIFGDVFLQATSVMTLNSTKEEYIKLWLTI